MEVFGYRKLCAYNKGKEIVKCVYKLLKNFPLDEKYDLCSQIRRAAISVTSNIAEGVNRYSVKDKSHFIEMSYGSLMELSSQLEISQELGFISIKQHIYIDKLIEEEARILSGLYRSYTHP